jgi:glycine N-methyltransferase
LLSMSMLFDSETLSRIDQYDGEASAVWDLYIGDHKERTNSYKSWLCNLLHENGCHRILDAAAGTGPDSIMLVEQGFRVTSVDLSDQMLNKAREERWTRRAEPGFGEWEIVQANWLSLEDDLAKHEPTTGLYDAVILLGNSFTHLPNEDQKETLQKQAMANFNKVLRPGGLLILDHRNYDAAREGKRVPSKSHYYHSERIENIDTYMISKNGKFHMVVLDYFINAATEINAKDVRNFKLFLYPLALTQMKEVINDQFQPSQYDVYGDFEKITSSSEAPAYYCHVAKK